MELDAKAAAEIAQKYFHTMAPLTRLGWGISGYVFLSRDVRTAVKIHRRKLEGHPDVFDDLRSGSD